MQANTCFSATFPRLKSGHALKILANAKALSAIFASSNEKTTHFNFETLLFQLYLHY